MPEYEIGRELKASESAGRRPWSEREATAQAMEASDERALWEAYRKLPSDFEPHGQRRWPGKLEERPDCATCRWFMGLFRTWPDWGACANPESPRAGLLTFREQGCWEHEPEKERRRCQAARSARCDFMRGFERFLREQAADFIKEEVRKANDPSPDEGPSAHAPEHIRQAPLFVVVRRLLKHADEDFRRPAFDAMTARARKDTRRHWEFARRYWARMGIDISKIRLPENVRELEDGFWGRVDETIREALRGRGLRSAKKKRKRAG
jgi:hypothetical protein